MPYIRSEIRRQAARKPVTPGELNFAITKLCVDYLAGGEDDYQTRNDVMGALASAQAEFYRRAVVPFEECAIVRNGDVY